MHRKLSLKMPSTIAPNLLAACGINCAVCYVHLKNKKPCLGCGIPSDGKPAHCRNCKIKICAEGRGLQFCFECAAHPCPDIKRLDKSYRQRYGVHLIENTVHIRTVGISQYMQEEQARWQCLQCGGAVSMHDQICSECGQPHLPNRMAHEG